MGDAQLYFLQNALAVEILQYSIHETGKGILTELVVDNLPRSETKKCWLP